MELRKLTRSISTAAIAAGTLVLVSACADGATTVTGDDHTLVIYGSGAAAGASLVMPDSGEGIVFGPTASLTIKLYALYISANADCSNPVLAQDLGVAGEDKDFMLNPVLFSATPAAGTYPCIMLKMSDVLRMKPGAAFGACVVGTEYSGDIYRAGESDWKDVNLNAIVGTGTDEVPADDHVTIFITQDTAAAMARGISSNQLVPLQSSLVVPGQTTFRMDASHAVGSDGVQCGIMPPVMSFQ